MSTTGSALDTPYARIIAAAAAHGFATILLFWSADDVSRPFAARSETPIPAAALHETTADPNVVACLEQRLGDVERMQADGLIDAAQYELFKNRATSYCNATGAAR